MRTELSTEPLSHEPNRIARSPAPPGAGVVPWALPPPLPPPGEWPRYLAPAPRFKGVALGVTLARTALGARGALLVKPTYVARPTGWVHAPPRPAGGGRRSLDPPSRPASRGRVAALSRRRAALQVGGARCHPGVHSARRARRPARQADVRRTRHGVGAGAPPACTG